MSRSVTVTVFENGPLKISSEEMTARYCGAPLAVEAGEDVFLCRCGESRRPPFCDGSHKRAGFIAEPAAGTPKEVRLWEGKRIRTFFNPNACMHALYCKPLGALRQRELEGSAEAAVEIARIVRSCPSGALSCEAQDVLIPDDVEHVDVDIMEGGEVRIQCAFEINAALHERQSADRATLCRCGLSKNKPWCDGRHKRRAEFR